MQGLKSNDLVLSCVCLQVLYQQPDDNKKDHYSDDGENQGHAGAATLGALVQNPHVPHNSLYKKKIHIRIQLDIRQLAEISCDWFILQWYTQPNELIRLYQNLNLKIHEYA